MKSTLNDINGVLLIDKEPGITSHDVVSMARKKLLMKKIGHCGTLDPIATGLLMLVLGKGTKMQDLLMSEDKIYEGEIKLGESTSTQDKQGEIISEKPVPDLNADEITKAFEKFTGEFYQVPPMVSAIKKDGVPLYKLARKGITIERKPRLVKVHKFKILKIDLPFIQFRVLCSKGFYVRTYAHEIGGELNTGAHLNQLRRLRSGNFDVKNAIKSSDLKEKPFEEIKKNIISLREISLIRGK